MQSPLLGRNCQQRFILSSAHSCPLPEFMSFPAATSSHPSPSVRPRTRSGSGVGIMCCHVLHAISCHVNWLLRVAEAVIENAKYRIRQAKVLAGLLPGLGLFALAFSSFQGTSAANSPRSAVQPFVSFSMAVRNASSPCRRANCTAASRTLRINRLNVQAVKPLKAESPTSCRTDTPSSPRSSSFTASRPKASPS